MSLPELNRRLLLFAARTMADARKLRDPRRLGPTLARGTVRFLPLLVGLLVGTVRLALMALGLLARAAGRLARRGAGALLATFRRIDFNAVGRALLTVGAVAGAGLLIAADLSTVRQVTVLTVIDSRVRGGSEHYYALVVLGVLALPLIRGAVRGRSRPAMVALAAIGLVALAVALAVDLPRLGDAGDLAARFDKAHAGPGPGFVRELAGGGLLFLSGLGLLRLTPRPVRRRQSSPASELASLESPPAAPAA